MGILAECPVCRRKQGVNKKACVCGENMDKAKKAKRVKYWIDYYLPSGKARRECVGTSIEEAREAFGKRRTQKREDKFFEIRADSRMTFKELAKWYLNLEKTQALKSNKTVRTYLRKFCDVLGGRIMSNVKLTDLENLQERRKREGLKPKTIDHELNTAKRMVIKAFQNDIVSGPVLRMFQNAKHQLKGHANRRERHLTVNELH